ncbi:MAG: hypothetical protein HQL58_08665 [Magnetococcales bacterium]|nr:hypothetical protein [Magnetococcales bacterium]
MTASALQAMLTLVEQQRQQQQSQIMTEAHQEAAAIVAAVHQQARQRMKEAIRLERRRLDQALKSAQAQQETELRRQSLDLTKRLLHKGRALLDQALVELWQIPEHRATWISALGQRASLFLPPGQWEVHYPSTLDRAELAPVMACASQSGHEPPLLQGMESIQAGLSIGCQDAWVDGTAAGLVADRDGIDALLLAQLQSKGVSL